MSGFIWTKEKEDVNNDKEIEEIIEEDEIFVIMRNDIPLGYYKEREKAEKAIHQLSNEIVNNNRDTIYNYYINLISSDTIEIVTTYKFSFIKYEKIKDKISFHSVKNSI